MPTRRRNSVSIEIDGLRDLQRRIRQTGDKGLGRELRQVNRDAADIVKNDASPRVPVRTGRLRSTLKSTPEQRGASVRLGGPKAPYAPPIHWGWRAHNIRPRPVVWQAYGRQKPRIIEKYREGLARLARKIERR